MKEFIKRNLPMIYLFVFILFAIFMGITPKYRHVWFVENIILVVFMIVMIISYKYFKFSNFSYSLIFAFCILQTIGAHYSYAEVPLGYWMQSWFGFERNNYDRIVHFMFGFLLAYPVREFFIRTSTVKKGFWVYFVPIAIIAACGSVYEIMEWGSTYSLLPEGGEDSSLFLGAQGDVWDAEKDMALVALGGVLAMLITLIFRIWKRR